MLCSFITVESEIVLNSARKFERGETVIPTAAVISKILPPTIRKQRELSWPPPRNGSIGASNNRFL
jgi:hypothetical protein